MSQTPWGTPESGNVSDAPVADREVTFALLIEQTTGSGEGRSWGVSPEPEPMPGSTRADARALALQTAKRFRPEHPWNERRRRVLKIDDDTYLTLVEGSTRLFHFRVTVVELVPGD